MDKVLEYCLRGIVRYLDGDIDSFRNYRDKALEIYELETSITTIGEVISDKTKKNLHEMVS